MVGDNKYSLACVILCHNQSRRQKDSLFRGLGIIFEEREVFEDYVEEEVSKYKDHIYENSESDSEFDKTEEEVIDHKSVSKQAPGPACQQPDQSSTFIHKCNLIKLEGKN